MRNGIRGHVGRHGENTAGRPRGCAGQSLLCQVRHQVQREPDDLAPIWSVSRVVKADMKRYAETLSVPVKNLRACVKTEEPKAKARAVRRTSNIAHHLLDMRLATTITCARRNGRIVSF